MTLLFQWGLLGEPRGERSRPLPRLTYTYTISRPKMSPSREVLMCEADLSGDIGELLPYLNAHLDGWTYNPDEPSLLINLLQGKAAALYPRRIALRGLRDEEEAVRYLDWLVGQIEEVEELKHEIVPRHTSRGVLNALELYQALPGTNCGECGLAACMAFAAAVRAGELEPGDCPPLGEEEHIAARQKVNAILKAAGWRRAQQA